jgi:hypothetical protein
VNGDDEACAVVRYNCLVSTSFGQQKKSGVDVCVVRELGQAIIGTDGEKHSWTLPQGSQGVGCSYRIQPSRHLACCRQRRVVCYGAALLWNTRSIFCCCATWVVLPQLGMHAEGILTVPSKSSMYQGLQLRDLGFLAAEAWLVHALRCLMCSCFFLHASATSSAD